MRQQEIIPVYVVMGFLESGKTTMISSMLEDEGFSQGAKTLILCCEEGEEEYDIDILAKANAVIATFDSADDMTALKLKELNTKYRPERIIMEYNSMWKLEKLGQTKLPPRWEYVQVIDLVDATTFDNYMTNMRVLLTDPMKEADMVLVNRCNPEMPKSPWRRQIRALNPNCSILFENTDGTTEDGVADEDLPYDMKAEIIEIADEHVGTFYMDALDHPERYDGKNVRVVGQPFQDHGLPAGYYLFGREAMTCCANDIAKIGWVCQGTLKPTMKSFFTLTAKCRKVTQGDQAMIMMEEMHVEKAAAPKEEYVTFS